MRVYIAGCECVCSNNVLEQPIVSSEMGEGVVVWVDDQVVYEVERAESVLQQQEVLPVT